LTIAEGNKPPPGAFYRKNNFQEMLMKSLLVATLAATVGLSASVLAQTKDPAKDSPLAARDAGQSSPLAKNPAQESPLAKRDGGQDSPLAKPATAGDSPLATTNPNDSPLAKSEKK
jgi:hypothetical protein